MPRGLVERGEGTLAAPVVRQPMCPFRDDVTVVVLTWQMDATAVMVWARSSGRGSAA